ncbi:MAG: S-layer homology domain-containing protein [bacterium]|nr:S-layer homology domain-containing protein [bacterium]MDA1292622.1 S-layer homology domain-containing protein [bacterium]
MNPIGWVENLRKLDKILFCLLHTTAPALLASIAAAFFVPTAFAEGYKMLSAPLYPISFEYPADWELELGNSGEIGSVTVLNEQYGTIFIQAGWDTLLQIAEIGTAQEILDIKYSQLAKSNGDYRDFTLDEKESLTIEGYPALRVRGSAIRKSVLVEVEFVYVAHPERTYTIYYVSEPTYFDRFYPDFENILRTALLPKSTTASVSSSSSSIRVSSKATVTNDSRTPFNDVPSDAWYASKLLDARIAGFVSGYKDANGNPLNLFGPADPVTVAELLKMTIKATAVPSATYENQTNIVIDHWSNRYVSYAIEQNVGFKNVDTQGFQDFITSHPDKPITRAEAAGLVHAFFNVGGQLDRDDPKYAVYFENGGFIDNVNNYFRKPIRDLVSVGILTGDTDVNGNLTGYFRPGDPINRAEALMLVIRANSKLCMVTNLKCPKE